jgi:hypothetical protein
MFGSNGPKTWPLAVSDRLPAAQGSVTVKPRPDGNSTVDVVVAHLAPPERAAPGASAYVVWLVPRDGAGPQNMGVLTPDDKLNGEFHTTTPFRDFDVRVTAEPNARATSPTAHEVMHASVAMPQRAVR